MSKRKLLLADDSITIQKVVNLTFADEGIEVIAVGDGDSAMRKFDEFMPDLVMADVNMPGLNGYEVCRIIKQTEETQNIPVILLVGSFEPFDEAEAKGAGADDFLTKPFQSIRQLVNKVTELLDQRGSVSETPPGETPTEAETEPPVDSFAETLKFESQPESSSEFDDRQEEISSEFGDAGMDDEMIETSPANDYVSASSSDYQAASLIDYSKTQPLNAEDLKDININADENTARETQETVENQELAAETPERAEPATFDEEARKLDEYSTYDEPETEENPPVISETEPQIDYYLPTGEEEFEKQISDADTLEPEVSYSTQQPREADFSQTETVDETETAVEEISETEESSSSIEENETADFDKTPAFDHSEPEISEESEEVQETSETETDFVEEPQTAEIVEESETEEQETLAESETEAAAESFEETESDLTENVETEEVETVSETPVYAPVNAASLNFDDGDLLELPPLVEETGIRPQPKIQPLVSEPEPVAAEMSVESSAETAGTEAVAESGNMQSFPPELIEAIAQKIADKISAQTMNDVLPQITELVMKKMAEEKLKE